MVHLVQDMGQPQHTRNEVHCGGSYNVSEPGCGHKSVYEKYIEARATGEAFTVSRLIGGNLITQPANAVQLVYGGYPIPQFDNYASFFTNRHVDGGVTNRVGLADYSNRGFFTAGKNLGQGEYALPVNDPLQYNLTLSNLDWLGNPLPNGATVTLLEGTVRDALSPTGGDVAKLSTVGAFDQFLKNKSFFGSTYTLTRHNYDDMANLLIPRAVGYSAGLINYFFRGKLNIDLPAESIYAVADFSESNNSSFAGFKKLKARVSNATAPITVSGNSGTFPQNMTNGNLFAVLRYKQNNCLKFPSLEGVPGSASWNEGCRSLEYQRTVSDPVPVPPGINSTPQTVAFNFQTALPFNATDVDLYVVYRGQLGSEADAIAVGHEWVSEPTFFNVDNFNDCITGSNCSVGSTEARCLITQSFDLPFAQGGGVNVASVTNLGPGQYARAAFIARTGYKLAGANITPVLENQLYPYGLILSYSDGEFVTWEPGPFVVNMEKSRPITGQTNVPNMYSWHGIGNYPSGCVNGVCNGFAASQSCTPINPTPQPVTINF